MKAELKNDDGENLTHHVTVAPLDVYHPEPGDQIRHSTLGIQPVPLADVTYLYNLKSLGYDMGKKFVATLHEAEAAESTDTTPSGDVYRYRYRAVYRYTCCV